MDHTVRVWDLIAGKCRQTMRGHVDSVNAVAWQPGTANVFSASSDKTVSLWDGRTGLCVQTYYGHTNRYGSMLLSLFLSLSAPPFTNPTTTIRSLPFPHSCNHLAVSKDGNKIVTCDADGYIKVRMCVSLSCLPPLPRIYSH